MYNACAFVENSKDLLDIYDVPSSFSILKRILERSREHSIYENRKKIDCNYFVCLIFTEKKVQPLSIRLKNEWKELDLSFFKKKKK